MIVRNEAHCIERCIKSVLPYIDAAVIVDTGSTDGTPQVIGRLLDHMPYSILYQEWVHFGYNRTHAFWNAVDYAGSQPGYALVIDADEVFYTQDGFSWPTLDRAGYAIWQAQGQYRWLQPRLLHLSKPWVFQGALHEVAELLDPDPSRGLVEGCSITGHFDSARNHDQLEKYKADAEVMETMPETPRNVFYKAKCYEGAKKFLMALQLYQRRVTMKGYDEETYLSWIGIARMEQRTGARPSVIARAYEAAYHFRPTRAEAPYYLAQFCKERGHHTADYWFLVAASIPMTTDQLFVDTAAYHSIK